MADQRWRTLLLGHLERFDFCRLRITLEFTAAVDLPAEAGLRLRRDLLRAGRERLSSEDCQRLFDPPPPLDPSARRRFQRPASPFVCSPPVGLPRHFGAGDGLVLPVLFLGDGIQLIGPFLACLAQIGRWGFWRGAGPFEIGEVAILGPRGESLPRTLAEVTAGADLFVDNARWWLEERPAADWWSLQFTSPARLVSDGRPLFRPTLADLFPFVLRRVMASAYHHCGLELDLDPRLLQRSVAAIEVPANRLAWQDWRTLEGEDRKVDLGGVAGRLTFRAPPEPTILQVLLLGSLLNLGKGAAFGAGHFCLVPAAEGR